MRLFILVILLLASVPGSYAQSTLIQSFGLKAGMISSGIDGNGGHVADPTARTGFEVGVFTEWFSRKYVALQPSIAYTQRGFRSLDNGNKQVILPGQPPRDIDIRDPGRQPTRVDYLTIPILLKIRVPLDRLSFYVLAGPRFDFVLHRKPAVFDRGDQFAFELTDATELLASFSHGWTAGGGVQLRSLPVFLEALIHRDLSEPWALIDGAVKNRAWGILLGYTLKRGQ